VVAIVFPLAVHDASRASEAQREAASQRTCCARLATLRHREFAAPFQTPAPLTSGRHQHRASSLPSGEAMRQTPGSVYFVRARSGATARLSRLPVFYLCRTVRADPTSAIRSMTIPSNDDSAARSVQAGAASRSRARKLECSRAHEVHWACCAGPATRPPASTAAQAGKSSSQAMMQQYYGTVCLAAQQLPVSDMASASCADWPAHCQAQELAASLPL
jgi:hypothetical protein